MTLQVYSEYTVNSWVKNDNGTLTMTVDKKSNECILEKLYFTTTLDNVEYASIYTLYVYTGDLHNIGSTITCDGGDREIVEAPTYLPDYAEIITGDLNRAHGITLDGDLLYVADRLNNKIKTFNTTDGILMVPNTWDNVTPDLITDIIKGPTGMNDIFFVINRNGNNIVKCYELLENIQLHCGAGFGNGYDGEFDRPYGITNNNNTLFITDTYNHRVQMFGTDGNYLSLIEGIKHPRGIDIHDGKIYVTSETEGMVYVFDLAEKYLLKIFGSVGGKEGQLDGPMGISVSDDYIAVAERDNNRVSIFDHNLNFVKFIDRFYEVDFDHPHGVELTDDKIYISDTRNSRIVVLTLSQVLG